MIDRFSKIEPWNSIGGVNLCSHISTIKDILDSSAISPKVIGKYFIKYQIDEVLEIWINIINGKVFKITALSQYQGKLWDDIEIGSSIGKVLQKWPEFEYDDFEELYITKNGVILETDPISQDIIWISIFIPEMLEDDFENSTW